MKMMNVTTLVIVLIMLFSAVGMAQNTEDETTVKGKMKIKIIEKTENGNTTIDTVINFTDNVVDIESFDNVLDEDILRTIDSVMSGIELDCESFSDAKKSLKKIIIIGKSGDKEIIKIGNTTTSGNASLCHKVIKMNCNSGDSTKVMVLKLSSEENEIINCDSIIEAITMTMDIEEMKNDSCLKFVFEKRADCNSQIWIDADNHAKEIINTIRISGDDDVAVKTYTYDDDGNKMELENADVDMIKMEDGTYKITIMTTLPEDEEWIEKEKLEDSDLEKNRTANSTQLETDEVVFYPNPNTGTFNLKFDLSEKDDVKLRIYDMEGKQIFVEEIKNFTGHYDKQIDISKNGKGTYFLQITQNAKSLSKKIIIQ